MTPWTVACQAPLTMGFPREEYWRGLPFPSPGDLPPGIKPASPALAGRFFTTEPPGKSNRLLKPLQFCQSHSLTYQALIIFPWKCLSRATLSPPLPNNPSSLILNYKCFCIPQIAEASDQALSYILMHCFHQVLPCICLQGSMDQSVAWLVPHTWKAHTFSFHLVES